MYEQLSPKQIALYLWREIEEYNHCDTMVGTGAIRTGKTEIGSKGFGKDSILQVRNTPKAYRTKGYNLYSIISTTKALALLNIIEPMVVELENKGYKECRNTRQFYRSKGNVFVHTTHPMGIVQVKDYYGNITRYLYIGADNKRALTKVTGLTLRGWFLDEAPLLGGVGEDNIKFIELMYERTATFKTDPYGRPLQVMTTNPQTDEKGMFYQKYIKNGWEKGILVLSFTLLDNPIFKQEHVDYYKKIFTKAQFLRKILGKWVRDNSISTYPKFAKRHIVPHSEVLKKEFVELRIGLDEGQSDARAFVLTGFEANFNKVVKIDEFYYKNTPDKEIMDINDYVKEFWRKAVEWYGTFKMTMILEYDSASLVIYEPLIRYRVKHKINIPLMIKAVNKARVYNKTKGKGSAIKERWEFTNILFGSDSIEISDKCEVLIDAYNNCINKDGERVDDGKTNNIDIIDASEYGEKARLKLIQDRIMLRGLGSE